VKIELNMTNILTSIVIAVIMWMGSTLYRLDKEVTLLNYQLEQVYPLLQDLYESKKDIHTQ